MATPEPFYAQVHRFHDVVAIYVGNGETVYFTPSQARELGKALITYADDVDASSYMRSQLGTFRLEQTA